MTNSYSRADKLRNTESALTRSNFTLSEANLLSLRLESALDGVEVIFHQVARPGVRSSWGEKFDVYTTNNILATPRLLEACCGRADLKRFVFSSSLSVNGSARILPVTEDSPTEPSSPCGVTKLAAEHFGGAYHTNFGVPTVSLRYFTVYGAHQRPDMAFRCFIRAALRGDIITVHEDSLQTRVFTHASDIVDANIRATKRTKAISEIYNIAGGSRVPLSNVWMMMGELLGRTLQNLHSPKQAGDVRDTYADTTRASRDLGYKPRTSLESGQSDEIQWLLSRETPAAAGLPRATGGHNGL